MNRFLAVTVVACLSVGIGVLIGGPRNQSTGASPATVSRSDRPSIRSHRPSIYSATPLPDPHPGEGDLDPYMSQVAQYLGRREGGLWVEYGSTTITVHVGIVGGTSADQVWLEKAAPDTLVPVMHRVKYSTADLNVLAERVPFVDPIVELAVDTPGNRLEIVMLHEDARLLERIERKLPPDAYRVVIDADADKVAPLGT